MSKIHIVAQQNSPSVSGEGATAAARGTRDGIQYVANWQESLLLEGRVFQITGTPPPLPSMS